MKLQLIFLTLFVVAALGYRDDNDNENRINRRGQGRGYRWRRRYDNQIAANAEDAELEDAISQEDESTTERYQRRKWRGRGENRRNQFKHNSDWHKRHEDELSETESNHNQDWHEKHGVPMPDENTESGKRRHCNRHRHRHHHRHHPHHRNHTTTSTTSSTSTLPPQFENEIDFLNDNIGTVNRDP